jgi:hypothetical protein
MQRERNKLEQIAPWFRRRVLATTPCVFRPYDSMRGSEAVQFVASDRISNIWTFCNPKQSNVLRRSHWRLRRQKCKISRAPDAIVNRQQGTRRSECPGAKPRFAPQHSTLYSQPLHPSSPNLQNADMSLLGNVDFVYKLR